MGKQGLGNPLGKGKEPPRQGTACGEAQRAAVLLASARTWAVCGARAGKKECEQGRAHPQDVPESLR